MGVSGGVGFAVLVFWMVTKSNDSRMIRSGKRNVNKKKWKLKKIMNEEVKERAMKKTQFLEAA